MGRRLALLVATFEHEDAGLRELTTPAHDAERLAEVLQDPAIAGFEVAMLVNQPHYLVGQAISDLYRDRRRDDLTLLYFTGHGLKDDMGRLYLATSNTRRDSLMFTALAAEQIDQAMSGCRSRQKVLILDCCYSGAFPAGRTAKADTEVHALERFQGAGRTVLTASDAAQYSFEGQQVSGDAPQSVFTRHLVAGLRDGSADLDGDGDITLDELYSYVHDRVVDEMPQQRPKKQDNVEGRIVIARNVNWNLPAYIQHALSSPITNDRLSALDGLERLHRIGNEHVRSCVVQHVRQLAEDDSRSVAAAAVALLASIAPGTRVPVRGPHPAPATGTGPTAPAPPPDPGEALPGPAAMPAPQHVPGAKAGLRTRRGIVVGAVIALAAVLGVSGYLLLGRDDTAGADGGLSQAAVDRASRSVVKITVTSAGSEQVSTGFVIDDEGRVIAPHQVAEKLASSAEDEPSVTMSLQGDESPRPAEVVATAKEYGIALLEFGDAPKPPPPALRLDTGASLTEGQAVSTVGYVDGVERGGRTGHVRDTAKPEWDAEAGTYFTALETSLVVDADSGMRGAPLLAEDGVAAGVILGGTEPGKGESRGSVALPAEQLDAAAEDLLRHGSVRYPTIGAHVALDGKNGKGAVLADVENPIQRGGPADQAGLKPGDGITAIDETKVGGAEELLCALWMYRPGATIELTYVRRGDTHTVDLTLEFTAKLNP